MLVGLTLLAAVLIIMAGSATIGDVNEDSNAEVAGQTFQQADESFRKLGREGGDGSRTLEIPESMQGEVGVEESSWRLQLNDNSACNSGQRHMGEMRYSGDEETVGYEGGGVWKMTESGATMDSPPQMTYQGGSLSVNFPNISGDKTTSNELSLSSNASEQRDQNRNLSKALYTNLSYDEGGSFDIECAPNELDNATLYVNNSEYASAWARYFRTNYEDRRLSVETTRPIEPGDDVKVRIQLGDVTDPEYKITDYNVTRDGTADSEPMEVNVNVTNRGGLDGDQPVEFEFEDPLGSDVTDSEDLILSSNETKTVTFTVSGGTVNDPPYGTYEIDVDTQNDTLTKDIQIDNSGDRVTELLIDNTNAPQNASVRADEQVEVTLENDKAMTVIRDVEFRIDGTTVATKKVTVDPTDSPTIHFDLPTDSPDNVTWTVDTGDDTASDKFAVGSNPYFAINQTDSPAVVPSYSPYELDVNIRNIGHLNGTMPVEITIEKNTTGGWSTEDTMTTTEEIGGTVYPSNETDLTYRKTFIDDGEYRYTVETENETTAQTFHVGAPEKPTLIVDDVEINENPTTFDEYVWVNVTVENVGDERANQDVQFNASGEQIFIGRVSVSEAGSYTVGTQVQVTDSRFDLGHNSVSIETANASVPKTLIVQHQNNLEEGGDGIVVNENVKAEIKVLGAEPEYNTTTWYGDHRIFHGKLEMWLDVRNDTHHERVDLWQDQFDGNVNHPRGEKEMIESSSPYTLSRNFSKGSEISVFARSHSCGGRESTDVVFEDVMPGGEDAEAWVCTADDPKFNISNDDNKQNVVILTDGDSVPSYGAAAYPQRDLDDMLGHRITDDGTLSLGPQEAVYLYETTKNNSDPGNATGTDDPDYNDAVVLFRVVDVQRTAQTPADFEIEDVDAKESVARGNDSEVTVTVNNTGGTAGKTDVFFDMQGQDRKSERTESLDSGETDTVTIDIPTDLDPDSYQYTVLLGSDPLENHYGAITIGEAAGPSFQISSLSAPGVNETDESPDVTLKVTNTGTEADTQNVRVLNTSGVSSGEADSESIQLDSGETKTITLALPESNTAGYVTYNVKTDDTTTRDQAIYYGESDVETQNLAIGTSTYSRSDDLIEVRGADRMHFKLENVGNIGGARDVRLEVRDDSGSPVFSKDTTVQIGDGEILSDYPKWLTFDVGLDDGYYDYTLTVEDDGATEDTWDGELFISEEADVESGQNSSSPISVDSNQVVISD